MLGINTIVRLVSQARYSEVVEGCLRASVPLPLSIRLQLESESSVGVSARALGLLRGLELSYRLTDGLVRLAEDLLDQQQAGGSFSEEESPAVDVQALAALSAFRRSAARDGRFAGVGRGSGEMLHRGDAAIGNACEHLSALRAISAEGLVHDLETSAFLMVVLARFPRLRGHIDPESLGRQLADRGCAHDRRSGPLFRHARALMSTCMREELSTPTAA